MRYFLGAIWAGIETALDSLFFARDAMSFPLPTLLELRRRDEDRVLREVVHLTAVRGRAEDELRRREGAVQVLEVRLLANGTVQPDCAEEAQARDRWRSRLAGQLGQARAAVEEQRSETLARALVEEEAARARHQQAVAERRALEKVLEDRQAEERRVAERRADDQAAEVATARRG
jgi:hypothetical protein